MGGTALIDSLAHLQLVALVCLELVAARCICQLVHERRFLPLQGLGRVFELRDRLQPRGHL